MFDRVVRVIVGIISVINHDGVFQGSLDALTGSEGCLLTCTLRFLQPMRTFPTLIQTCTVCCALEGTSNIDDACGCLRLGVRKVCWAPSRNRRLERVRDNIVCIAACSFVPFLLPLIGVMRLDIFDADVCIVYRREKHSRKWRRIRNGIFCLFAKDGTPRQMSSVSTRICEQGISIHTQLLSLQQKSVKSQGNNAPRLTQKSSRHF